jgi:hypothetical protein
MINATQTRRGFEGHDTGGDLVEQAQELAGRIEEPLVRFPHVLDRAVLDVASVGHSTERQEDVLLAHCSISRGWTVVSTTSPARTWCPSRWTTPALSSQPHFQQRPSDGIAISHWQVGAARGWNSHVPAV